MRCKACNSIYTQFDDEQELCTGCINKIQFSNQLPDRELEYVTEGVTQPTPSYDHMRYQRAKEIENLFDL